MSGSICSDRTSGLVYLQSNHIVTHIPLSLHFRTYVAVEVLGASTRVGHRTCTRAFLHVRHTRSLRGR